MLVRTEAPARVFIDRFEAALADLLRVAAGGSDEGRVRDESLDRFRGFFPDMRSAEESDAVVRAWRKMSLRQQAAYEATARWDLANLLHMLGDGMRSWAYAGAEELPDGTVEIRIVEAEFPCATGAVRQVAHFAGGSLVDDEAWIGAARRGWWPWRRIGLPPHP